MDDDRITLGYALKWSIIAIAVAAFLGYALQGSRLMDWLDTNDCYYDSGQGEEVCPEPYERDF